MLKKCLYCQTSPHSCLPIVFSTLDWTDATSNSARVVDESTTECHVPSAKSAKAEPHDTTGTNALHGSQQPPFGGNLETW